MDPETKEDMIAYINDKLRDASLRMWNPCTGWSSWKSMPERR